MRITINITWDRLLLVVATAMILGLFAVSVLWGLPIRQKTRAGAFLRELTQLELGKSTFADAQRIAQKYGGIPWYTVSLDDMRCTFQECRFAFKFENKPLTSFRLVRYVVVLGFISVKDGLVTGREIDYARDSGGIPQYEFDVIESVLGNQEGRLNYEKPWGLYRLHLDEKGIPWTVRVRLVPTSSEDQRERAFALDFSCLASLFGCHSPAAMFPTGIPYQGVPSQTYAENW